MSNKRIPNLSVTDGFDFVKKIWGSLPIPSVMNPTTDLDELDKRISDLKAVEQWLNVNLSMLRATIQGLEVQRGTIATIKSFSSNLGLGGERGGDVSQAVNEEIIRNAMQAAVAPPPVPRVEPVAPKIPDPEPDSVASAEALAASQESSKAIISNATAWWGLLQDQFNKVATAAMTGSGLGADEASATGKSKKTKPASEAPPVKAKTKRASTATKKTSSTRTTARSPRTRT
jgi:hypothetical protein